MAYSYTNSRGNTYILHAKTSMLKDGNQRTLYFFAKEAKEGALDALPQGYQVGETANGLPVLKKIVASAPAPMAAAPMTPASSNDMDTPSSNDSSSM